MAVDVDLHARRVEAGVRALLEDDLWSATMPSPARADLGAEIHRRVQSRQARTPGFSAEVAVTLRVVVDAFAVELRGRIDGLFDAGRRVVVEEIKSHADLDPPGGRTHARAVDQACIYAWALVEGGERRPIDVRVRYVSVIDGRERLVDAAWSVAAIRRTVERRVRFVVEQARHREARQRALRAWARALAFPYAQPRPHQLALVDAFTDALASGRSVVASAPTGIGKTVCALVPALRVAIDRGATLSWCTSRTTQPALVRRTLRACVDRAGDGPLVAITLRSKASSCPPGHLRCHPDACGYLADFGPRARASEAVAQLRAAGGVVEPQALDALGRRERLCPWELARRLAREADVVIGDSNYAFDPNAPEPPRAVVRVIDEAHGLPARARARDSPFVACDGLERARAEVRADAADPTLAGEIGALLDAVEAHIGGRLAELSEAGARADAETGIELDTRRWSAFASRATALVVRYGALRRRLGLPGPTDPLTEVLRAIVEVAHVPSRADAVAYVAGPRAPGGAGLGLVALDCSARLARTHARALGTLAVSATLSPMKASVADLGLAQLDAVTLTVPSVFDPSQLHVAIATDVDTTLRGRARHYDAIADHIRTVRRARPGNYVAFASSHAFVAEVARRLDEPGVLVETVGADAAGRRRIRAGILARLRHERGLLLLAVLGGVFSEGVDLPGEALSGAIVVGPGVAPPAFASELRRRRHDAHGEDGFVRVYAAPAMARVVQAAGRVLRGLDDRGVLVLLGRRFVRPPWVELLPRAWTRGAPRSLVTRDLGGDLREFWGRA